MQLNRSNVESVSKYPVRILQYGEGNFLRAFADWIVQQMNNKAGFNTGIDVVQPLKQSIISDILNKQDGLYHVYLRGMKNGMPIQESEMITCLNRVINPYDQYDIYSEAVLNPSLHFVISNTTEAGITYDDTDTQDMAPQNSFPGKIASMLYNRFEAFNGDSDKGLIFFTCELIDRNGDMLKKYVLKHAENWKLGNEFITWVENHCAFCNTLVDRIVPGFPKDEIKEIHEELGFEDNAVVVGEYFHSWIIEAPQWVRDEFPAGKAGLAVKFVKDMTRYREQKVRVLNGSHTGSFAVSLLYGIETVRESVENMELSRYMKELIYDEILKGLSGDETELKDFATKILERFHNPYICHQWESIALNALSKWETRCLPTLIDYLSNTGELPPKTVFSLDALIAWYRGNVDGQDYNVVDDPMHIDFFNSLWAGNNCSPGAIYRLTEEALAYKKLWKKDLNEIEGLTQAVSSYLFLIVQCGMKEAIKSVFYNKRETKKIA